MSTLPHAARRPAAADASGLRIPEQTVALLRDLVAAQTGIHYDTGRLDLLRDRLVPLALEHGFDSLLDYYYLLKYDAGAEAEWRRVFDALAVQETYFWREADQFRALAEVIVPRARALGRSPIRIWSIPCATGEEPLSIAIALEEARCFEHVAIEIHASDASEAALARAARGRYGRRSFRQLPDGLQDKYFTRAGEADEWLVKPELRARVTSWTRVNLVNALESIALSRCDVIFCRNLFIYFTPAGVREIVTRLAGLMPSPGFLCVGASESLLRLGTGFELQDLGGAYVYVKP